MRRLMLITIVTVAALIAPRSAVASGMTYLALGDSVAFGETDFTKDPSNGNRGYVAIYANKLAAQNGGVAPNVVNLAIDGETTSSFTSGSGRVPPGPGFSDASLESLNTRYTNPAVTQFTHMLSTISNQLTAGNTISDVSVSLGSNDLFALALSPSFQAMTPAQQKAALTQTLGTIQSNYTTILTDLHALLPHANVLVMGSYNPFPAVPTSPFAPFAAPAIAGLNQVLQAEAAAFGARYIDAASAIAGHEAAYTYITDGTNNVHPNALGYAAIAAQMTPVPEPTTIVVFAALALGLVVRTRRSFRTTAS